MRFRAQSPTRQPAGYVLTIVTILVLSFLVIALVIGAGEIRNALAKRFITNLITDADATDDAHVIGKPVDFGICEEPTVLCPDPDNGLYAWVGVRPDRFVTRNQVFYANTDCSPPVPGASCPDSPVPVSCEECGNCDPVTCPENCTFSGNGVYLAPPALPAPVGVFPPEEPFVGYLNGSFDVDGTPARVVYGVGSPGDWIACNSGVTPNLARLPCVDGGVLWRGGGPVLTDTPIQSVWTSLAPDCAPGEVAPTTSPTEPVPILAAWDFKSQSGGTESAASFIAPEANVTTDCSPDPPAVSDCMIVRNRPATAGDPPGWAQFGPQPSSPQGGCNCASGIACLCDGPSLPAQLSGIVDAPSPTGVQIQDNDTDFTIVPVGSTACIIDDPPIVPERCGTVSVVGTNTLTLSPAIPGGVLAGDEYRVDLLGGGGEPPFLQFEVSCADLDPGITEVLSSASVQFNARKVSSDGQETGRLHLFASCDGFTTFTQIQPTFPAGAPAGCGGQPPPCLLDQDFGTVYAYDLDSALGTCPVPGETSTWTIRITSERTGGSQERFDARLDDAIFSAFCQDSGSSTAASGFTEEICINTALSLDLIQATEVTMSGGTVNVLAGFDPFYTIMPPDMTRVDATPEGPGTDTGGGTITRPAAEPEGGP